eukprot:6214299-Pleurochrysis_carterae.AAC.2
MVSESQPPPQPAAPAAEAIAAKQEILEQRPEQQEPATWGWAGHRLSSTTPPEPYGTSAQITKTNKYAAAFRSRKLARTS